MSRRESILDPPKSVTGRELAHWKEYTTWFATLLAGEEFWNEAQGRGEWADVEHVDRIRIKSYMKSARRREMVLAKETEAICERCKDVFTTDSIDNKLCCVCVSDDLNKDEEDFWASIGCPD
jgi:hypothetical protein